MKYFIWITIDIIWLFGLNMILPADDSNTNASNNSKQKNVVYTNKVQIIRKSQVKGGDARYRIIEGGVKK